MSKEEELQKASQEYIWKVADKNNFHYSHNDRQAAAFIEGFEFSEWCRNVSMTNSDVSLHIKYRMFINQRNAKFKKP